MGTNYYMRRIPTKQDIIILQEQLNNNAFNDMLEKLRYLCKSVHIGKRSSGWKFLFDHNDGKYYDITKPGALYEFIHNPEWEIFNEYNEILTADEFIKMVEDWNNCPNNKWTSVEYEKYEKQNNNPYYSSECNKYVAAEFEELFGIRPVYNDIIINDIRYSVYTDFS